MGVGPDLCPKSQMIPGPLWEAWTGGPVLLGLGQSQGQGQLGTVVAVGSVPLPCPKPLIFTGTEITDRSLVLPPPQHRLALYQSPEPPCGLQRPSAPLRLSLPTWIVGADTQLYTLPVKPPPPLVAQQENRPKSHSVLGSPWANAPPRPRPGALGVIYPGPQSPSRLCYSASVSWPH